MRGYSKVQNGISSRSPKSSCNKRKNYKGIFYFMIPTHINYISTDLELPLVWFTYLSERPGSGSKQLYLAAKEKLLKSNSGRPQASHLTFPGLRSTSVKWGSEWDNTVRLPALKTGVKWLSPVRLFATPWTVAYHAPPSMGFSRQEYWSGLPFPSPEDLPDPGFEPGSPSLWAHALPSEPPGKS